MIASHSNCRRLCDVPRNLTDEQIKTIAATGGLMGINSYPAFIASAREKQDLQHLTDHLCMRRSWWARSMWGLAWF